jgi:hypothetical protein
MDTFWDESDYFTGPALTAEAVADAEGSLGYSLPAAYVELLRSRNGGCPRRDCFPTTTPTSWADDHIALSGIRGIGGEWGIDSPTLGSEVMIEQWGYPRVGIVVGECPSAGHDVVMLDYSLCGPHGEPQVIHVETERDSPEITVLAPNFAEFIEGLVAAERFDHKQGS